MSMLMDNYTVNPSIIGYPKLQLGTYIIKVDYGDVSYAWTMRLDYYVKEDIRNVKKNIKDETMDFNKKLYDINCSPKNTFSAVKKRPEWDTLP